MMSPVVAWSCGDERVGSADFNDLNVSDIGTFKLHQEGKLMDFDVNIMPQGGIYGCAYTPSV